jgi:hypothetical protein
VCSRRRLKFRYPMEYSVIRSGNILFGSRQCNQQYLREPLLYQVSDIELLANAIRRVSFVKVDRMQNNVSQCFANFARTESKSMVWIGP